MINKQRLPCQTDTLQHLVRQIGSYPDAVILLQNCDLIDPDNVQFLLKNNYTGWSIAETIARNIDLNSERVNELVIECFGYKKIITGSNLIKIAETLKEREKMELIHNKQLEQIKDIDSCSESYEYLL